MHLVDHRQRRIVGFDDVALVHEQLADARHVNNRATAFLAFVELGVLGLDDIGRLCRIKRRYHPRPQQREMYDKLFAQFLAAFRQNRPIFEALNG